jgi:hypothetical protein
VPEMTLLLMIPPSFSFHCLRWLRSAHANVCNS